MVRAGNGLIMFSPGCLVCLRSVQDLFAAPSLNALFKHGMKTFSPLLARLL